MNIALLCPGPSLPAFWGQDKVKGWDLVVAVNTAGLLYACDWLCFADQHIGEAITKNEADPPCIGYVTHPKTPLPTPMARENLPLKGFRCKYAELLPRGEDQLRCCYTFPNALWFCQMRQPDEIHIYGFDCSLFQGVCLEKGQHTMNRWLSELPWIKHCWGEKITVHSELPQAIRRWLVLGESATRQEWQAVEDCLRVREVTGPCESPS